MFPLIRNFTIASLFSMTAVTLVLGYSYHRTVENHITQHIAKEHMELSKVLATDLWKEFGQNSTAMQNLSSQELIVRPEVQKFASVAQARMPDFGIKQLNIYAVNGRRILSTDLNSVGATGGTLADFNKALAGRPVTKLLHQVPISVLDEPIANRDIIINFIPLYNNEHKVNAVAEVRADLTKAIADISGHKVEAYTVIVLNLGLLFVILLLIVRRADRHMKHHAEHIQVQQRQIEHQNYHDTLTGLPNCKMFRNRLHHAIQLADQRELLMAVLVINLHRLKHISDTLGHAIGDGLMLEAVKRLKKCIRKCDTLARVNSDEFYIMLESIAVIYEVEEIAAQILQEFSLPTIVDDQELYVTPSIGIAMFPFADEDDEDTLIKKANTAMYDASDAGRNTYRFYDNSMPHHIASRFSMESALRRAVEHEEFELFYQPVVHLKSGKIITVEALLRWRSPELGLVPPMEFVPLLEETGLIMPVGKWVLETACAQAVAWHRQGFKDLKVNVNVSAVQFSQKEISSQVRSAIDKSGIMPYFLDLEITESLLIDDINNAMQIMDALNDMGVSLSIDDFGTGYSSLAYLKRMPIGTLKIDRSFVCDLNADADDAAIVDAVCALANSLRFNVTAEGVETREQLEVLRQMGVDAAQGFLFSQPLPVSEITNLLRRKSLLDFVA